MITHSGNPPPSPDSSQHDAELALERTISLAFAPMHKAALGLGFGTAAALVMLLLTSARILLDPQGRTDLSLLAQYFAGYEQSWQGALIGAAWGFFVGAIVGWFLAFTRNLVVAIWLLVVQARADLESTRDFMDHI